MTINFADALSLLPATDVLTTEVVSILSNHESLKDLPATQVAAMRKFELAKLLKGQSVLPETMQGQALPIASAVLEGLREMEIGEGEESPAQPQQPIQVRVELPKGLDEMSLSELLTHIANNPTEAAEAIQYLEVNPIVVKAKAKSLSFAIVEGTLLKADLTVQYINHLAKPHTQVLRQFQGVRPTTLEAALGLQVRPLMHPFTGEPIQGPDEYGRDFGTLPEELHLALLWAKQNRHSAWPSTVDVFTHVDEIFQNPLPTRWQTILADFQHAKSQQDGSTEGLSRYWNQQKELQSLGRQILGILNSVSEPQVTPRNPWQNQPTPAAASESQYKQLLEEVSAKVWSPNNYGQKPRHRVVMGVQVGCYGCNLNDVVSLGPVVLRSYGTTGTVYVLRGTEFQDLSYGNDNVIVIECGSYQELAHKAGLIQH